MVVLVFYEVFLVILVQEKIGKSGRILYLVRKVIFPEFGAVKVLLINYKMQTRDSLIGLVLGFLPDIFLLNLGAVTSYIGRVTVSSLPSPFHM